MSRMEQINARISELPNTDIRIVYFITEDREFLEELFRCYPDTFRGLLLDHRNQYLNIRPEHFYRKMLTDKRLVDLDAALELTKNRFRPAELELVMPKRANQTAPELPGLLNHAAFLYISDFHQLNKDTAAEVLKHFISYSRARENNSTPVYLFLLSPVLRLPMGFEQYTAIIDVPEMDETDIRDLLLRQAPESPSYKQPMHSEEKKRCMEAAADFRGVSRRGILQILADLNSTYNSFYGSQRIHNANAIDAIRKTRQALVAKYKQEAARQDGTITLLEPSSSIAGMTAYTDWLEEVRDDFADPETARSWGINPPKGVLLTGVPGSGKTQAAKMTAYTMGGQSGKVMLVQFRMDNLLGGLVGETENNFKRCKKRVRALAPCVVLIDEIEKLFATKGDSQKSDVKMSLLALLLDWLQENDKQIFFFATCNSVANIAPELIRDARFDMRMYAFMPSAAALRQIIAYHLNRTNKMTGSRNRFGAFSGQYQDLAADFLREVTKYAKDNNKKDNNKDMFFTGANIEVLIKETNKLLRRNNIQNPTREKYLENMMELAKSSVCQPYGETNMHDIVEFWILARMNKYSSVDNEELLPFAAFDESTGAFVDSRLPKCEGYDAWLQQRLRQRIEQAMKAQSAPIGPATARSETRFPCGTQCLGEKEIELC